MTTRLHPEHRHVGDYVQQQALRTSRRAEAAVDVLLAVLLGIAGAMALAHWWST